MTSNKHVQWIIGVILLVTTALVVTTFSVSHIQGQSNSNVNVNVNNEYPYVAGMTKWYDAGTLTPFSDGDTIPGVVGGSVSIIMNINVVDPNGYDNENIAVRARLMRTLGGTSSSGAEFTGSTQLLNGVSPYETTSLPDDGAITCDLISTYSIGSNINVGGLHRCSIGILYLSDPTAAGTSVNASLNYQAERWNIVYGLYNDGALRVISYTGGGGYFEYDNILGLSTDTLIDYGEVTNDGTPSGNELDVIFNRGNQQIDIALEVNKQIDGGDPTPANNAWNCTGGGYPLVSDIHYTDDAGDTYAEATPLTLNLANTGYVEETFDLGRALHGSSGGSYKNEYFNFATTQPIGEGVCTLSYIVITAVQGY